MIMISHSERISESKDTSKLLIPSVVMVSKFALRPISRSCELRNHDTRGQCRLVFAAKAAIMAGMGGAKMRKLLAVAAVMLLLAPTAEAQPPREKIIIDTDIGDDIDDAFAVALALSSPEFEVLGFSASFGDTPTRAKMLDCMLGELGHGDIPVAMGTLVDGTRNA